MNVFHVFAAWKWLHALKKNGTYGVTLLFRPHYTLAFGFWVLLSSHCPCACNDGLASDRVMIHLVLYKASKLATATALYVRFLFWLLEYVAFSLGHLFLSFPQMPVALHWHLDLRGLQVKQSRVSFDGTSVNLPRPLGKSILVVKGQKSRLTRPALNTSGMLCRDCSTHVLYLAANLKHKNSLTH